MLSVLLLLIGLAIGPVACQLNNNPPANEGAPSPRSTGEQTQRVKQTVPRDVKDQSGQARAERLAKLALRVPQVKGATAVVIGTTAIVGIDVDQSLDRGRVGSIKFAVAEALREDPQGATAAVTADPDIVQRVRAINTSIRNGQPGSTFADELANLIGRIMPQYPKDVQQRERPDTRTNEQRINQQDNPNQTDPSGNKEIPPRK